MAVKNTKMFHSNFQSIPKLLFLVWKYTIWQLGINFLDSILKVFHSRRAEGMIAISTFSFPKSCLQNFFFLNGSRDSSSDGIKTILRDQIFYPGQNNGRSVFHALSLVSIYNFLCVSMVRIIPWKSWVDLLWESPRCLQRRHFLLSRIKNYPIMVTM
jgi:1,4-dihydroxy-2-naphthoate octaprenyltransferase